MNERKKALIHNLILPAIGLGLLFIMTVSPFYIREYYYATAPLENFVDIEKIEGVQLNERVALYIIYREVKGGVYEASLNRRIVCLEELDGEKNKTVFASSAQIQFEPNPENSASVEIPLENFDPRCHTYRFEVQYILTMPNGEKRDDFGILKSNPFRVIFEGETLEGILNVDEGVTPPRFIPRQPENPSPTQQTSQSSQQGSGGGVPSQSSQRQSVTIQNEPEAEPEPEPQEEEKKGAVESLVDEVKDTRKSVTDAIFGK